MGTQLKYAAHLETSDPQKSPVTIIGQLEHLKALSYDKIKAKLEPRVSEEVGFAGINDERLKWHTNCNTSNQKLKLKYILELLQTFKLALVGLTPSPTDSCPLYLNLATVVALPKPCSRHNTASRAHALTKVVKNSVSSVNEYIVVSTTYM
jgi:probable aminopeptidase NPEPL1